MTLLQKMDRLVYATGIDRIIFMKFQPRTFRWSPLLVIAVLVVGYVLMARTSSQPDRSFLIGSMLFYGAFMVAVFLRLFGPASTARPLDERQLMVKSRAYAVSGIVFASLLMSLLYLGGESAQVNLALPSAVTGLFQGTLLFFLLAADVFVNYRVRIVQPAAAT